MPTKIVELEVHTICAGQLCVNVLHFVGDTAITEKFLIAKSLVQAFDETTAGGGFTAQAYADIMAASCYVSAVMARVVGTNPGAKYPKLIPAASFPGVYSGELYSQQVACNIKLVTASGPDFTGRIFLPGVPEDAVDRNRWAPDYITAITVFVGLHVDGITNDDAEVFLPAVYKRSTQTWEMVTNDMLVPNPATIRRRLSPV